MSLLTIVQDVTDRLQNMPRPDMAGQSTDDTVRQIVALINDEGRDLAATYQWNVLTRRVEKPAIYAPTSADNPASDQGAVEDLAPGFLYIIDQTLWLANQPFRLLGPMGPQSRTGMEAWKLQGAVWYYWIEDGHLWVSRPTSPEQSLLFRYQSSYWVKKADGTVTDTMRNDSDTSLLPERCIMLGAVWRWLQRNGLPYQQDYLAYQQAVSQYAARDGTRPVLEAGAQVNPYNPQNSIIGGVMTVR